MLGGIIAKSGPKILLPVCDLDKFGSELTLKGLQEFSYPVLEGHL